MNKFGNKFNSLFASMLGVTLCGALFMGAVPGVNSQLTVQAEDVNPVPVQYTDENGDEYDYEYSDAEYEALAKQEEIVIDAAFVAKYDEHIATTSIKGPFCALRWALSDASAAKKITINKADYPVIADPSGRRLMIYSNKELDLGGATLKRSRTENLIVVGNPDVDAKGYAYTNIKIHNGTIDGGKADAGLCRFARVENLTLDRLNFVSFGKHAAEFAALNNASITNCTFQKPNYNVKSKKSGYEALSFDMTSNDADFEKYGPADYLTCKNVTIYNCTFKDLYRGLGSHHYINKKYYEKIVIDKCKFVNIEDTAVECAGWINSKIKNCTFNKVGFGIDFKQPATSIKNSKTYSAYNSNSTIENNTFVIRKSGNKTFNSAIRVGGFTLDKKTNGVKKGIYYLNKFTVKNNTVKGKSTYCIIVDYTKNTVVTGNKTSGAAVRGISFWYAPGHVDKNNVDTSKKKTK